MDENHNKKTKKKLDFVVQGGGSKWDEPGWFFYSKVVSGRLLFPVHTIMHFDLFFSIGSEPSGT